MDTLKNGRNLLVFVVFVFRLDVSSKSYDNSVRFVAPRKDGVPFMFCTNRAASEYSQEE